MILCLHKVDAWRKAFEQIYKESTVIEKNFLPTGSIGVAHMLQREYKESFGNRDVCKIQPKIVSDSHESDKSPQGILCWSTNETIYSLAVSG